jgi:TetR/AcrR family transcriptional regulator
MHERFQRLVPDKRARIINAGLAEFAAKGYRQASTDDIVARAGISKGSLFHYFGNKETFYLFLLDWAVETIQTEVHSRVDLDEPDLFARLAQGSKVKFDVLAAYPQLWGFLETVMAERPGVAAPWLDRMRVDVAPQWEGFLAGVDTRAFRRGLDAGKIANVVAWTFAGFSEAKLADSRVRQEPVDLERVFAEADEYVAFLRAVFCEPAPQGDPPGVSS